MKALLLREYSHLELSDVPTPAPGPGELLIQVAACGICGSDVLRRLFRPAHPATGHGP
jgi:D-arabinose 1-dehydrogenase-like Zn-dependent alcohol dehydrogenase